MKAESIQPKFSGSDHSFRDLNRAQLWETCCATAKQLGVWDLFQMTWQWKYFPDAYQAWTASMEAFVERRTGVHVHSGMVNETDLRSLFVARSTFEGDDPEFWIQHSALCRRAAADGDAEFFARVQRGGSCSLDPRQHVYDILRCWLPAGLWCARWEAAALFISRKCEWPEHDPQSVMAQCGQLKLFRTRKPRIRAWTTEFDPLFIC